MPPQAGARVIGDGAGLPPRVAEGGARVEEIAARAHLSPGTVRNYLSSAVTKLGVANRHEAVELARSRGWI